ncbi:MAG: DUF350 domain-containing protein, partial [Kangiellaceae bacterium]|nr:DUF350 domain-containing protein [Kangiellaceae bacterium]
MEWSIIILNFVYALIGSLIALMIMMFGYKLFDRITPFDTHKELDDGNVAVGIVVGCIFLGVGIAVGLVIG